MNGQYKYTCAITDHSVKFTEKVMFTLMVILLGCLEKFDQGMKKY